MRDTSGLQALRRGFLPGTLPAGFAERLKTFRLDRHHTGYAPHPVLGEALDLFGDASVQLVALEGHARGQFGALLQLGERRVLLAADASWISANHEKLLLPSQAVRLFFDDWEAFQQSLARLHNIFQQHPDIELIPSHCPEAITACQPYTHRD